LFTDIFCASKKYKTIVIQYRPLHFVPVGLHECKLSLGKQESQLLLGWTNRTTYIRRQACDFWSRKRQFLRVTAVPYTTWWRSYIERYN